MLAIRLNVMTDLSLALLSCHAPDSVLRAPIADRRYRESASGIRKHFLEPDI